jgi:hypothetical protein
MNSLDIERPLLGNDGYRYGCWEFLQVLAESVKFDLGVVGGSRWPDRWRFSGRKDLSVVVTHDHAVIWVSIELGDGISNLTYDWVFLRPCRAKHIRVPYAVLEVRGVGRLEADCEGSR